MSKKINFDEVTIADDFMFGTVFRDEEKCKELLNRILGIRITSLERVEEQKSISTSLKAKSIRIDIYAKDDHGNTYDIEMQLYVDELELRSRYYHSEMDGYQIKHGQSYKDMKYSIVIFICTFDMFGDNRSIYTFKTMCEDNPKIVLKDKRITMFVNTKGDRESLPVKTKNLLDYIETGKPTDKFTREIEEKVQEERNDDEWRLNYMTLQMKLEDEYEKGREKGLEKGLEEGEKNIKKKLVNKWLQSGKTVEEIANLLGETEQYIEEIKRETK